MKKIDVIVKDLHTLELNEDAKKGDIIDLEDVVSIDPNFIKGLVEKEKRVEYQKMFESERRNIELNYENQLKNKEYEIEKLRNSQANEIRTKVLEAEIKNNAIVNDLKRKVSSLEYDKEILELKSLLNTYKNEAEIEKNKEINALKEKYENDLREAENKYERLKREKSALNVKNIGEDLENGAMHKCPLICKTDSLIVNGIKTTNQSKKKAKLKVLKQTLFLKFIKIIHIHIYYHRYV